MKEKEESYSELFAWAEKEIEAALKKEGKSTPKTDMKYVHSIYKSALNAYKSLIKDGHSGFSWARVVEITERLMHEKPLTAIEDNEEDWEMVCTHYDYRDVCPQTVLRVKDFGIDKDKEKADMGSGKCKVTVYQNKRMSSFFKYVFAGGNVRYNDVDRFACLNIDYPEGGYSHSKLVDVICNDIFPIEMPYYPNVYPYEVMCRYLLTDAKNGDYDTFHVMMVKALDGSVVKINRYFKTPETEEDVLTCEHYDLPVVSLEQPFARLGYIEIDEEEYKVRMDLHDKRKGIK